MQARYLGSDSLSQRQLQVQETAEANALAVGRMAKATNDTMQGLVQGQQQLGQMEIARASAEAQAAANSPLAGLSKVVEAGTEAYIRYDSRQKQESAAKAEAVAKANKAREEQFAEEQFLEASAAIDNLSGEYIRSNWDNGTLNYRNQVGKALASYKGLDPKRYGQLLDKANAVALGRDEEVRKNVQGEVEKQQLALADSKRIALQTGLQVDIDRLSKLPPTEQALPYLKAIESKLDGFMQENSSLTFAQKLGVVNSVSQEVLKAFGEKSETYATFVESMKARAEWATGYQQLYGKFMQDNDQSAFKDGILQLKIRTGKDYSDAMVAPGEAEEYALKLGTTLQKMQELQDTAREKAGVNFSFGDDDVRQVTAAALIVPGFTTKIESNPLLAKNPAIKAGLEGAKAVQRARVAQAELGILNAQTQKQLADYDISNVNNFASVTRSIISRNAGGQQMTAEQQYFSQMLSLANQQSGGAIGEAVNIVQNAGNRALTKEELAAIQTTLNNSSAAIRNAQQQQTEVYKANVNKFNAEHETVLKAFGGRVPTDEELARMAKDGFPRLEQRFQELQQKVNQAGQQALPAYGQQSNFNAAGQGIGAFASPSRQVKIAPRTAVHVQTTGLADGGSPFITPVQAGVVANHSFNKGMYGGGYRAGRPGGRQHAGIDFPLRQGQNAVSLVSGRVVFVGTASGYGNYIEVMGDNGFVYRYSHSRALVKQGEQVLAGQPVATPNLSGTNVGGAHLHFEVRNGSAYKPGGDWGVTNTVDPIAHLRSLTPLAGTLANAPSLSGQSVASVNRQLPWAKTTAPSLFTNGGGALQANLFQQVGRPTQNASQVFTPQRPLTKGTVPSRWNGQQPKNNTRDDHGYSWIAQRPTFAARLAHVADALGVPAFWIADIMRQETGENFALANGYHPNGRGENANRNYGLFGFGSDSGVRGYDRMSPEQQLDAYYNYMKNNGWIKHYQRTNGNVTIGQLWAMTKMGTKWRQDILNGRDPATMVDRTGKSQLQQFEMLGQWAGRRYDFGQGRRERNKAVGRRASSSVEQALVANNSPDVSYRTTYD